ncbi:MAG TPA: alpha/beta hydrolase [Polyangiaceae bacterium]
MRAVLLIHGSGMSGASWGKTLAGLGDGFRVLAPDLVGYARNGVPVPRGRLVDSKIDLELLRPILDADDRVDLVGHSYGGVLAAKLALEAPQRVGRLILIEPVLFSALRRTNDEDAREELSAMYDEPSFLDPSFGGTEAWTERFMDYWWGSGFWARMGEPAKRATLRTAWKMFCEVRDVSSDPAPFAAYATLPTPLTLLRGTKTTACARRVIDHLKEHAKDAEVAELEGAGHMSPLTHGEALGAKVRELLLR